MSDFVTGPKKYFFTFRNKESIFLLCTARITKSLGLCVRVVLRLNLRRCHMSCGGIPERIARKKIQKKNVHPFFSHNKLCKSSFLRFPRMQFRWWLQSENEHSLLCRELMKLCLWAFSLQKGYTKKNQTPAFLLQQTLQKHTHTHPSASGESRYRVTPGLPCDPMVERQLSLGCFCTAPTHKDIWAGCKQMSYAQNTHTHTQGLTHTCIQPTLTHPHTHSLTHTQSGPLNTCLGPSRGSITSTKQRIAQNERRQRNEKRECVR